MLIWFIVIAKMEEDKRKWTFDDINRLCEKYQWVCDKKKKKKKNKKIKHAIERRYAFCVCCPHTKNLCTTIIAGIFWICGVKFVSLYHRLGV